MNIGAIQNSLNQALSNGVGTVSQLRPDVQYMQNGLVYVIEINRPFSQLIQRKVQTINDWKVCIIFGPVPDAGGRIANPSDGVKIFFRFRSLHS